MSFKKVMRLHKAQANLELMPIEGLKSILYAQLILEMAALMK